MEQEEKTQSMFDEIFRDDTKINQYKVELDKIKWQRENIISS